MDFDSFFIKTSSKKIDDFSALLAMDYQVDIGRWFSRGWETFKALAAGAVAYAVVAALCYGASNFLLPGSGLLLQYPLLAGFIIAALMHAGGSRPEMQHYFWGFRYLLPLLAFTVVSLACIVIGFFLLLLPGLYLAVAYQFAPFLIIEKNLDFWPAMELSRKKVSRHFFDIFALSAAVLLLNCLCLLTFGLSLFFTLPLSIFILDAAYRDIFSNTAGCGIALMPE